MTDEEVVQCKQVIYSLIGLEMKHEPLQMPNMGQRGKGPKRCVFFVSTRDAELIKLYILLTVHFGLYCTITNTVHYCTITNTVHCTVQ
jgi:hypothetical protein